VSFGKGLVPNGYVVRTFRVKVMATPAKKARAYNLLVSGGDTWAWCIDRFHAHIRGGLPNANSVVQMWPDQKRHGPVREIVWVTADVWARGTGVRGGAPLGT
jgi:hypothetical protein